MGTTVNFSVSPEQEIYINQNWQPNKSARFQALLNSEMTKVEKKDGVIPYNRSYNGTTRNSEERLLSAIKEALPLRDELLAGHIRQRDFNNKLVELSMKWKVKDSELSRRVRKSNFFVSKNSSSGSEGVTS